MKLKKLLAALLASTVMIFIMGISVFADETTVSVWDGVAADTSWYDSSKTDFEITSAAQFAGIAKLVNDGTTKFSGQTVNLMTDIDLNQKDWTPIGSDENDTSFRGNFNGNNHTISNLRVVAADDYLGLFGYAGVGGDQGDVYFKDFVLENAMVKSTVTDGDGGSYVGGVIANGRVIRIENVDLKGNIVIEGYGYVGGILGHGYPNMRDCDVLATGTINAHYWCAGAIAGYTGEDSTRIINCTVAGVGENGFTVYGAYGGVGAVAGLVQTDSIPDSIIVTDCYAENISVEANSNYCVGYIAGNGEEGNGLVTGSCINNVVASVNGTEITAGDASLISTAEVKIGNKGYATLQDALNAAVATKGGNVTVEILDNIDLTGTPWTPVYFNSYSADNANTIVIEGNEKTITGLSDMMFSGVWTGDKLEIRNLTLDEANIKNDAADTENKGVGAFVGNVSAVKELVITNCHLTNSHVEGGHWTGGFVGYAAGYSGNDGPVFTEITVENCSVTGSTITGKGSVGGIVGHATGDAWTTFSVEETAITENTVTSTGSSTNKAGIVMGTIGAAGTAQTTNGITRTGGVNVAVTESGNVAKSNETTITTVYGRQGSDTGVLTITGGTYANNPIEENVSYAAPAEGYEIVKNEDNTYGVVLAEPEILENSLHVTYTELGKFDFGDGKGEVSSIRLSLFAGVDTLNYSEAGFDVTVNGTTETFPVKVVYGSVKTMMNGTEETIPASKFGKGVNYIFGQTINFPATDAFANTAVKWTPYAIRNKEKITGNTFTLSDIFPGTLEVAE